VKFLYAIELGRDEFENGCIPMHWQIGGRGDHGRGDDGRGDDGRGDHGRGDDGRGDHGRGDLPASAA